MRAIDIISVAIIIVFVILTLIYAGKTRHYEVLANTPRYKRWDTTISIVKKMLLFFSILIICIFALLFFINWLFDYMGWELM